MERDDYDSYLISIQVRYLGPSVESFNSDNLEVSIQLNGATVTWKPTPAIQNTLGGNLKGTIRVRIVLLQFTRESVLQWHGL